MRYREPLIGPDTLVISVTQSGETVDTLAAMEEATRKGALLVAITNVPGSQASRVADGTVHTRCGLEIGVCSTKTYTASITATLPAGLLPGAGARHRRPRAHGRLLRAAGAPAQPGGRGDEAGAADRAAGAALLEVRELPVPGPRATSTRWRWRAR